MPSRNIVKTYAEDSYYHIYARGINKQTIFTGPQDYAVFINLFKRYLGGEEGKDRFGRVYDDLSSELELLAFCLMPNHFHMMIFQIHATAMTRLLRRIMTSYTIYFNRRYRRKGPLFETTFKAARIDNEAYLWHISRYIHLNPLDIGEDYKTYPYSSYPYYIGQKQAKWIKPERVLAFHREYNVDYAEFVSDYEEHKQFLSGITGQLAD